MKKSVINVMAAIALAIGSFGIASAQCYNECGNPCEYPEQQAQNGFQQTGEGIKEAAVGSYNTVKEGTENAYEKTAVGVENAYQKTAEGTVNAYNTVKEGTVNTYEKAKNGVENLWNSTKEKIHEATE